MEHLENKEGKEHQNITTLAGGFSPFKGSFDRLHRQNISALLTLFKLGLDMKEVSTEIEIEAAAERVWEVLTDFAKFPRWNSFIKQLSGEARTGAKLEVQRAGGRAIRSSQRF
jgi:uncharacterized membrane protein